MVAVPGGWLGVECAALPGSALDFGDMCEPSQLRGLNS